MRKNINQLTLGVTVIIMTVTNGFSQSKNERIEVLKKQFDSLLIVNNKLYQDFEIQKQKNAQLTELNVELNKSHKILDSLLKISKNLINTSNNQFKLLSSEIQNSQNQIEKIKNITALEHTLNFSKSIYTQNHRDFFFNEKSEWDYEYVEYTYYFTSDSTLYKVELSPVPIRYSLFTTIYFDYLGNVISINHSTNEVGRTESSTNLYFDEFDYFFFGNSQVIQHKSRIIESSWEENSEKKCEELTLCTNDDHTSDNELENSCDKTEMEIRNRMFINRTTLLKLLEKVN